MKETFSVDLAKPRAEAFQALTDLEKLAALSEGKLTVSPVPDRPRAGRGSAVVLRATEGPETGEILCETLEWDPPAACTRRLAIPDLPATIAIRLEDAPGGTRVRVEVELEPRSMLYKMMLPMLALKLRGDKDKLLAKLRAQLDKPGPTA